LRRQAETGSRFFSKIEIANYTIGMSLALSERIRLRCWLEAGVKSRFGMPTTSR